MGETRDAKPINNAEFGGKLCVARKLDLHGDERIIEDANAIDRATTPANSRSKSSFMPSLEDITPEGSSHMSEQAMLGNQSARLVSQPSECPSPTVQSVFKRPVLKSKKSGGKKWRRREKEKGGNQQTVQNEAGNRKRDLMEAMDIDDNEKKAKIGGYLSGNISGQKNISEPC